MSKIERAINSKEVMKLKKLIGILAAIAVSLLLAAPLLAASLGISPSHTELEVPADGSATASFQVYYFSGDLQVSLVDIPLTVKPDIIHVDASGDKAADIQLTIYGDESLGSQVYDGYVRFLGSTGGTVAVAVKVKAKVTNVVEGQPIPKEASPPEQSAPPESTGPSSEQPTPEKQGGIAGLSSTMAIIIAGGLVFVGLIVLSIALLRRRRY